MLSLPSSVSTILLLPLADHTSSASDRHISQPEQEDCRNLVPNCCHSPGLVKVARVSNSKNSTGEKGTRLKRIEITELSSSKLILTWAQLKHQVTYNSSCCSSGYPFQVLSVFRVFSFSVLSKVLNKAYRKYCFSRLSGSWEIPMVLFILSFATWPVYAYMPPTYTFKNNLNIWLTKWMSNVCPFIEMLHCFWFQTSLHLLCLASWTSCWVIPT